MGRIAAIALVAVLAAAPANAQQVAPEATPKSSPESSPESADDGLSLMEQGARLLLKGLMREMEPAIDDLRRFSDEIEPQMRSLLDEFGPAFAELMAKIDDITAYHPPEMLPNGDIIMRRKTPLERERETAPQPGEDIEL